MIETNTKTEHRAETRRQAAAQPISDAFSPIPHPNPENWPTAQIAVDSDRSTNFDAFTKRALTVALWLWRISITLAVIATLNLTHTVARLHLLGD